MNLTTRRTLVVLGTAAAVAGIGGTALATTGSDVTSGVATHAAKTAADPSPSGTDKTGKHKKHHGALGSLRRLDHAVIVSSVGKGEKAKTVTRTLWLGSVTAVSPTSVTVKARDGKTQTYTVTKDTDVKQRAKGKKPADSSIDKIAKGDRVFAMGTGSGTVTAKRLVELPAK